MRPATRWISLLPLFVLMSCASTSELARRGDVALESGDMERAYDWARRALDRDAGNAQARQIMTVAADSLANRKKREITDLAAVDTVAAARLAIELEDFRARTRTYGVTLPADPGFGDQEAAIRTGAARLFYNRGVESLTAYRPKRAHGELTEAARYAPGYADLGVQLDRAWQEAVTRIAILPLNNEVAAPGLADQFSKELQHQMEYQLQHKRFRFTRAIHRDEVNRRLTVAQAGRLTREEAVELGRALGAQRVVFGRVHDLRSDTRTDTYREVIFHKVVERGEDGKPHPRYEEQRFEAVSRRREVSVAVDFEVLETGGGGRLAQDSQGRTSEAHTVFTRFQPVGSCDDYSLAPPDWEDGKRRDLEKEWRATFGSWTVSALLDRARRSPDRTRYESRHRPEFSSAGTSTPVWLDDLPPAEELAHIALSDAWMPLLDILRDLDGKDDAELLPRQ
jgi:hypothetical protein